MRLDVNRIGIWLVFVAGAAVQSAPAQQACESLKSLRLDRAELVSAVMLEAAPFKPQPGAWFKLPAVTVPHTAKSGALPARPPTRRSASSCGCRLRRPGNGKYLQHGNGGWAGGIPSWTLVTPLARAAMPQPRPMTGTRSVTRSPTPASPSGIRKLIDFGYRAVHETAAQAQAILRAYYGRSVSRSYFNGCSDGGREAMMEAQRYPEDFDGIIAGAPANNWTRHFTGFVWNEMALDGAPSSVLPAAKLAVIQAAALGRCDTLDGVKDALIEDPRKCRFDPAVVQCPGAAEGPDCLTPAQVAAVKKIYSGPVSPRTGERSTPGYEPGTEADPAGWSMWITGPIQAMFGNSFYSGAVYENPKWDWRSIDFDRDLKFADEKVGAILNSYNPDLRSFRAHGGKLIQYHGWSDAAIAPRDSIAYYERVQDFLSRFPDPRGNASKPAQNFYRLFMVPGMGHCGGGSGPNHFGNDDFADANISPQDAEHDVLLALDRWVTQGDAPDRIIGTGRIGGRTRRIPRRE